MNKFVEVQRKFLSTGQMYINRENTKTVNLSLQRETICNLQVFRMDLTWLLL